MEGGRVNPSDDKSAAPDGVVVPRELREAADKVFSAYAAAVELDEERMLPEISRQWLDIFFKHGTALRAILAAPPPASPSDDRLSGLREALTIAANHIDWCQQAGNPEKMRTAATIRDMIYGRIAETEATQKDQRAAPHVATPNASNASDCVVEKRGPAAAVHQQSAHLRAVDDPAQNAVRQEAAVGSGGPEQTGGGS